jgi:hypothetical protein
VLRERKETVSAPAKWLLGFLARRANSEGGTAPQYGEILIIHLNIVKQKVNVYPQRISAYPVRFPAGLLSSPADTT